MERLSRVWGKRLDVGCSLGEGDMLEPGRRRRSRRRSEFVPLVLRAGEDVVEVGDDRGQIGSKLGHRGGQVR